MTRNLRLPSPHAGKAARTDALAAFLLPLSLIHISLGILIASLYFLALIFADLSRKHDPMLPYILLWLPNIITVAVALHLHKRARHKG